MAAKASLYFLVLIIRLVITLALPELSDKEKAAVTNFQSYLRINTAQPQPNYESAIGWIERQASNLNLSYNIIRSPNSTTGFVVCLTWLGLNPELQSIFLYSHIDVVGVDAGWTWNPFGAEIDDLGNIYGRGAQDMKSIAVQHLEAIRELKEKGFKPNRTVYIGFFSGEEKDSEGIKLFESTGLLKNLNIGLFLDEGMPNEVPGEMSVYYAQRVAVAVKFTAFGKSGHGSLLSSDTPGEKIRRIINKLLDIRDREKSRLEQDPNLKLGDVVTINLNMLEGGVGVNVVPSKLSATFDLRFTLNWTYAGIFQFLNETCLDAGANVTYKINNTFLFKDSPNPITYLDEESWWWKNFQTALHPLNITVTPRVFPAGSDGGYARRLGIPTLGFSPIFNTSMRMHGRDEYLGIGAFLEGIRIYETLIRGLSYVEPPKMEGSNSTDKKRTTASPKKKGSNASRVYNENTVWMGIVLMLTNTVVFFEFL